MDPTRFDRLSKLLATRRTRRRALATGGVGIAATTLLAAGRAPATAQDATPAASPAATPVDPHSSADDATTHPEYLFVQPFDGGTWVPKPGEDGVYLLSLTGAAAQTTYFSDRPERITGLAPTQKFLDGLGFGPDNPPNAALVAQTETGEQDILVVELFNPVYDADAATLSYEAKVLGDYGKRGLAHLAQQQADNELASSFGQGSLFIDDCPDSTERCYNYCAVLGTITSGNCWDWSDWTCNPCGSYSSTCAATFPACNNPRAKCVDDIAICGSPGCCGGECCENYGVVKCPC